MADRIDVLLLSLLCVCVVVVFVVVGVVVEDVVVEVEIEVEVGLLGIGEVATAGCQRGGPSETSNEK